MGQQDYCIAQWKLVTGKSSVEKIDVKDDIVLNENKELYDHQDPIPDVTDQKKENLSSKIPQKPKKPNDKKSTKPGKKNPVRKSKELEDTKGENNSPRVGPNKENIIRSSTQKDDLAKNSKPVNRSSIEYVMKLADD